MGNLERIYILKKDLFENSFINVSLNNNNNNNKSLKYNFLQKKEN
jgi:hypothetical protein